MLSGGRRKGRSWPRQPGSPARRAESDAHADAKEELEDLFISNYRKLAEKMSIRLGSGLEGYIVKNIVHRLNLPFKYELSDNGDLEFIITFPKN